MPASFNIESLKAQAVAARTYAVARLSLGGRGCTGTDADVHAGTHQGWLSDDELIGKWGYSTTWSTDAGVGSRRGDGWHNPHIRRRRHRSVYHATAEVSPRILRTRAVSVPYLRSVSE